MKISALVPVYNLEKYIDECLESLIKQITNFDYEIVVVDDGSTDKSWEIICEYSHKHSELKAYRNPNNIGLAKTQKRLLSECSGDFLAYIDGDDIALPGKIQALAEYLSTNPDCALTYHEAEIFDSDTGDLKGLYSKDYYNAKYIPERATVDDLVVYGWFANASSVAFRRHDRLLEAIDERCQIILDHPWHILNVLFIGGTVDRIQQTLGKYRIHSDSFGARTRRSSTRREQVLLDQLVACENALANGVSQDIVNRGIAHYRFATAIYFLKIRDYERFIFYIEQSAMDNIFFDERHELAWSLRNVPEKVAAYF